jgi:hypothetical protein
LSLLPFASNGVLRDVFSELLRVKREFERLPSRAEAAVGTPCAEFIVNCETAFELFFMAKNEFLETNLLSSCSSELSLMGVTCFFFARNCSLT